MGQVKTRVVRPHLAKRQTVELRADTSRVKVDRARRSATGVRFMGKVSRNGRDYTEALPKHFQKYDRARIFLNHDLESVRAGRQRDIRLWAGVVSNPDQDGLCSITFNANKAGDYLMDLVEKHPDLFGLSPCHQVATEMGPSGKVVTDIAVVASVDAVLNPATTSSIWEEVMAEEITTPTSEQIWDDLAAAYDREGDPTRAALARKKDFSAYEEAAEEVKPDASEIKALTARLAVVEEQLKVAQRPKRVKRMPVSVEQEPVSEEVEAAYGQASRQGAKVPTLTGGATREQCQAYWND